MGKTGKTNVMAGCCAKLPVTQQGCDDRSIWRKIGARAEYVCRQNLGVGRALPKHDVDYPSAALEK